MKPWRCVLLLACWLGCAPDAAAPVDEGKNGSLDPGAPASGGTSGTPDAQPAVARDAGGGALADASPDAGGRAPAAPDASGAGGSGGMPAPPSACGSPAAQTGPDPAVNPTPIATADPNGVTTISTDEASHYGTPAKKISAGAGMVPGTVFVGGQGNVPIWVWKEPGAFLEYTISITKQATYALSLHARAKVAGGAAEVLIAGAKAGAVAFDVTTGNDFSRGHAVLAKLDAGMTKVRFVFTPRSAPVDVMDMQVSYGGQVLPNAGQAHALAPPATTTIEADSPADFYSIAFDAKSQGWPCVKTFCETEYMVQAPKAGAYTVSLEYKTGPGCMGIELLVDGQSQAKIKLDPAATATPPRTVQLPCGPARLRFRNPNYLDGAFCSSGATLGRVIVKPAP